MFDYVPWLSLIALGAYHGLNPGMGWLFAVGLGLQERSRSAVLRAFAPIALGHAISVGLVVAVFAAADSVLDTSVLGWIGGGILVAFGLYKLLAPMSHPKWVGMRVSARDLATWSFLMATAHGAGLMLIPVLVGMSDGAEVPAGHGAHADHMTVAGSISTGSGMPLGEVLAVGVHTAAMFVVMAAIAVVVFEKVGLRMLRRAWFNLDRVWAVVLVGTGAVTLALA